MLRELLILVTGSGDFRDYERRPAQALLVILEEYRRAIQDLGSKDPALAACWNGLYIVREVVQRFGGRIKVESEIGKGTAFHILFPQSAWVKT